MTSATPIPNTSNSVHWGRPISRRLERQWAIATVAGIFAVMAPVCSALFTSYYTRLRFHDPIFRNRFVNEPAETAALFVASENNATMLLLGGMTTAVVCLVVGVQWFLLTGPPKAQDGSVSGA